MDRSFCGLVFWWTNWSDYWIGFGSLLDKSTTPNKSYTRARTQTQSGDFEVSLLILASLVIKADGKKDQRELDFVRRQFLQMYGKERANHAFRLFKEINKQTNISLRQVCLQIQKMMDHASRLQLLHFLFGSAKSDDQRRPNEQTHFKIPRLCLRSCPSIALVGRG